MQLLLEIEKNHTLGEVFILDPALRLNLEICYLRVV